MIPSPRRFECRELSVWLEEEPSGTPIVSGLNIDIEAGECVAICGPSGAGKSTACLAAFGLTPAGLKVAGEVRLDGRPAFAVPGEARQGGVAFVQQDPAHNFAPHLKIKFQIDDLNDYSSSEKVRDWCFSLGIDAATRLLLQYPGECSGGELQRLALVAALLQSPRLLVADEPTAALDPITRDAWCRVVRAEMDRGLAVLLVTHDEAVSSALSARRVELKPHRPMVTARQRSPAATNVPTRPALLEVEIPDDAQESDLRKPPALESARCRFRLQSGGCVALVGPSGSGKTSVLNLVTGMPSPLRGKVLWEGQALEDWTDASRLATAGRMGIVLQHARQGLNPHRSIHDTVTATFRRRGLSRERSRTLAAAELEALGIPSGLWPCRPQTLSAGQAQRVALAQAFALRPALLVLDEPTAAQDAGHRRMIVQRLLEMREHHETAVLLATHDAELVELLAASAVTLGTAPAPGVSDGAAIISG